MASPQVQLQPPPDTATAISTSTPTQTTPAPFPVRSKTSTTTVSGVPTTARLLSFADKLVLTITQAHHAPNHWIHVPLLSESPLSDPTTFVSPSAPTAADYAAEGREDGEGRADASLLPFPHLTATTVFGGTKPEFDTLGQTLATTVASAVVVQTPDEQRMVVLGLGLDSASLGRDGFEALVGLCLECLS